MIQSGLTHHDTHMMGAVLEDGCNIAFYRLAVHFHGDNALLYTCSIVNGDFIHSTAILAGYGKALPFSGDAGVYLQAIILRLNAQNCLRDIVERPGSRTGQPAVLRFAGTSWPRHV